MFVTVGLRHHDLDVLADRLARRVSEQALGRRAEGLDHSPNVNDDHRFRNGVQDRLDMRLPGGASRVLCSA